MEILAVLLLLYLFLALVVFPIWALTRLSELGHTTRSLRSQLSDLKDEILSLRAALNRRPQAPSTPPEAVAPSLETPVAAVPPVTVTVEPPVPPAPAELPAETLAAACEAQPEPAPAAPEPFVIAPVPVEPALPPLLSAAAEPAPVERAPAAAPVSSPPPPAPSQPGWFDTINWEQFMGAKLFAWLGGLALFLGVAFFVKYSFDHDLIPPAVRVAIGFVIGIGLVIGGLRISREKYAITSQTLIAAGVVSLYAVTFACRSVYHFEFFGTVPTFLLMSLITATAFVLAVRLNAQVVAVLGILGGFLTPKLLATGVDNPVGLFGYLALLNLGLIAVSLHRRWFYLVPLGAAGTVLTMIVWANDFYTPDSTVTAMTVCLGFTALFIGAAEVARRLDRSSPLVTRTALALPAVAFCFAWFFLNDAAVAARTGLFFGYVALVSFGVFFLAWRERLGELVTATAGISVLLMIRWAAQGPGLATPVIMTVCLAACALYFVIYLVAARTERAGAPVSAAAIGLPLAALGFAWFLLGRPGTAPGPGLFFGFVFLTSLFLFALAWWEGYGRLILGAAGATVVLMSRWTALTFRAEQAPVVVTVSLVFCAIYFALYLLARRFDRATSSVLGAAVGLPAVALGFAFFLMPHAPVALLFGFILAADGLLLALAWIDDRMPRLHLVAGLAVFGLLSVWTVNHLTDSLLPWALAMYLVFAALHTVFPLLLQRKHPAAAPTWWSQLFPPLTLLLMLLPLFKLESISFLIWPAILLVDLIAIALAAVSASLIAVGVVLVLTLVATGVSLFGLPVTSGFDLTLLLVLGGFAIFFFAASLWLGRRLADKLPAIDGKLGALFGKPEAQLPAFASLLPFLLLIMACARLTLHNPSAVFGLGLLLVVLTLGLARLLVIEWLPACALAGMAALEWIWHTRHFHVREPGLPLAWYAGFYAIFAVYPFLFRRRFAGLTGPWGVAAMSGLVHFALVYRALEATWPGLQDVRGLVPILFVFAPLASLAALPAAVPGLPRPRLNQLAWFGGVALFFITLIFPLQFERQWLTVAWALEGAALLWLFHRVPHAGLRATGVVLLVTAFVRLALNPAVLGYHARSGAIFNWYLYAYGLTVAALFVAARLAAPPRDMLLGTRLPALFNTLATILAFLLLNVEIADFFTPTGTASLTFQFSGNFARDMSYTIGWALFALGLLAAGLWRHQKAARYAAVALLSLALLKLFFHDLAKLEALYRIGALFAVAVIAIVASFAYQRFLPSNEKSAPPAS